MQAVVYDYLTKTYRNCDSDEDVQHAGAGMVFQMLQENGVKPSMYHNKSVSTVVFEKVGEPQIVVEVHHDFCMQAEVFTSGARAKHHVMTLVGSDFIKECSVILAQGVASFDAIKKKMEDEKEAQEYEWD